MCVSQPSALLVYSREEPVYNSGAFPPRPFQDWLEGIAVGLLQDLCNFFEQECVMPLPFSIHNSPPVPECIAFWNYAIQQSQSLYLLCFLRITPLQQYASHVFVYSGNFVQPDRSTAVWGAESIRMKKISCLCSPPHFPHPLPDPLESTELNKGHLPIHDYSCKDILGVWALGLSQDEQLSLRGQVEKRGHCSIHQGKNACIRLWKMSRISSDGDGERYYHLVQGCWDYPVQEDTEEKSVWVMIPGKIANCRA